MAEPGQISEVGAAKALPPPPGKPRRRSIFSAGLYVRLFLLFVAFGLVFAALALTGKPIPLPIWAVAEIEARVNRALAQSLPEAAVAIGAVEVTVDTDWVPRLRFEDLRLLKPGGQSLLTLPDLRITLNPAALLHGQIRPQSLRLVGARVNVLRDRNGRFDFSFGPGASAPQIDSFAKLFEVADKALANPAASALTLIEAEALSLTLQDLQSGKTWQVGDGRLTVQNRSAEIAAELGLSLASSGATPGAAPAHAVLTAIVPKGTNSARVTAAIDNVAAQDLASQLAPLAFLGILDAPISGRISTTVTSLGITALEGRLDLGAGALQPSPETRPIAFEHAGFGLSYDPAKGRIALTDLAVESRSLRIKATGSSYILRDDGRRITGPLVGKRPAAFLSQIAFSQVMVDPEGLFREPVRFTTGALDLRLRLDPFLLDIGQLSLTEDKRRILASGRISADPGGWRSSIDIGLNEISHDRLLALWPVTLVPATRAWLERNLLEGTLFDVKAALRIAPGTEPRLHLGYSFADAVVRFLPTLPPIVSGYGYATIEGKTNTLVVSRGTVTPPEGGVIDIAGSVFAVPDITRIPAIADITLETRSSLTAALSLLDLPPFNFLKKAERPVNLGEGQARIRTHLTLPLQKKVALKDVDYDVSGTVSAFHSDILVPKRVITADSLAVAADPAGLTINGAGQIGRVPFDVTFTQGFGLEAKGRARIEGRVTLSQTTAEEFGLGLPSGMVSGSGQGQVVIDLAKDAPGELRLTSDLIGVGLAIPELGWSKAAKTRGSLIVAAKLGAVPKVDSLALDAAGLKASGSVTTRAGGGLETARFSRVQLDDWLDAEVTITGRGKRNVAIAVTGGTVDMRRMPDARARKSSGSGGGPLELQLDGLRVASGIEFTRFRGSFSQTGGLNGDFTALLNDRAAVRGTVVPSANGSAVRLQSDDAGEALAAAGVFASARNGKLDLRLTPRAASGQYDGVVQISNFRVRKTSILAELLSAISVIGLLEQLNGTGIQFNKAEAEFRLTPNAVEVQRGSAIGASLGVSMAGVYQSGNGKLAMQGVVSPIYLLNGIGAIFSKRGEGLLGFNYALRGSADAPEITVNPLSILTPGLFREIFRSPAPVLAPDQGTGG